MNQDGIAQTVSGADAALGAAAVLDRRGLQDLWIRARFADSLATAQAAHETQDRAEAALTDARAGVAEAARALVTARAQAQQRVAEAYRGSTTPRLAAALSGDGSAPAMAMARARVYVQAIRADDVQVMKRWHQLERRTSSHARSLASRVISARAASSQADAAVVELRLAGYLAGANTPTGPGPGIAGPGGVTGPSGPTGLTGSSGAGQIVGGAVAESQFWNSDLYGGGPNGPGANGSGALRALAKIPAVAFPVAGEYSFSDSWGFPRTQTGWHEGTDIMSPSGTPLVAVEDGQLRKVGPGGIGGNRLWLEGASGNRYYYAHLSHYAQGAIEGAAVRAGQVIGYVGDTGNAKGRPHLHFSVVPAGTTVWANPYPMLAGILAALAV